MPRGKRPNTGVKDLADLVLLIDADNMDPERLKRDIVDTFQRRETHPRYEFEWVLSGLGGTGVKWSGGGGLGRLELVGLIGGRRYVLESSGDLESWDEEEVIEVPGPAATRGAGDAGAGCGDRAGRAEVLPAEVGGSVGSFVRTSAGQNGLFRDRHKIGIGVALKALEEGWQATSRGI
jgi:hypothetical protein